MAALDGSMPLGMDMSLDEAIAERRGLRAVADDYAAPAAGGAAAQIQVGTRVYVGNLAWSVKWQELKDYFRSAGAEPARSSLRRGVVVVPSRGDDAATTTRRRRDVKPRRKAAT